MAESLGDGTWRLSSEERAIVRFALRRFVRDERGGLGPREGDVWGEADPSLAPLHDLLRDSEVYVVKAVSR